MLGGRIIRWIGMMGDSRERPIGCRVDCTIVFRSVIDSAHGLSLSFLYHRKLESYSTKPEIAASI